MLLLLLLLCQLRLAPIGRIAKAPKEFLARRVDENSLSKLDAGPELPGLSNSGEECLELHGTMEIEQRWGAQEEVSVGDGLLERRMDGRAVDVAGIFNAFFQKG